MKKRHFLALGTAVALITSCGGESISTNASLKTEADTLAYAYGLGVAEQGLIGYITQLGVLTDTASFRVQYEYMIEDEVDSLKAKALKKQLPAKLDSIKKANAKNLKDFMKGVNESFNGKEQQNDNAYKQGLEIGAQLKQMSDDLSKRIYGDTSDMQMSKKNILAGVATILQNKKPMIEDYSALFESKMKQIQETQMQAQYGDQIEEGKKYMEENKTKEGVVVLPSGLQYKVITEGKGEKPTIENQVKVHYTGTLIDGTVFDSSVERGEPATFGVGQVIKGWTEALTLMPVGSKWEVYIPSDLGYGAQNMGAITPFSTLIFEVELLGIEN